jgi:hypothetical protein
MKRGFTQTFYADVFQPARKQLLKSGVGVEKVGDRNVLLAAMIAAIEFFFLLS